MDHCRGGVDREKKSEAGSGGGYAAARVSLVRSGDMRKRGLSELTVGLRDFERIANLQLKLWDGGKVRVGAYSFSKLWKR